MPFWKSLLGGGGSSSSPSVVNPPPPSTPGASTRKGSSSSSAGSGSNSASKTRTSSSASSSSKKAATAANAGSGSGSASASSSISNKAGSAPVPIGAPLNKSVSGQSQSQSQSGSLATSTSLGGATSDGNGGAGAGTEEEDAAIPDTPYSSGHSPSHARHRFPGGATSTPLVEEADETLADTAADGTGTSTSTGRGSAFKSGSVSSIASVQSSATGPGAAGARQTAKPDIPTTHTILANPLPQPSSGLAAAISSVLPSSSSNSAGISSSISGNGKASSTNADGSPRTFDIDDMISRLLDAGYSAKLTKSVCLKNSEITAICSAAREVFLSQPTLIELSPPVKIVGDVHGQYSDLIRLFEMCGFPPQSNYLFLGDYVDRGKQSLETILLLLCYKVKYPENFFLLRGNHECANVTRVYGFYDECKRRCNIKIWKTFIDVFNCLPITALVAGKIFCVHGGLSPSLSSMDDIRRISRPTDVPDYGLLNDLLWSDPSDTALDWEDNERGVSYCFGKAVIQDFLAKYDFDLICRAHMVVEDGYEFWNERTLVTIFSAPNYCGEFDNFGSVMSVSEELLCSFELLKPLDGPALKKELLKSKRKNSAQLAAGNA